MTNFKSFSIGLAPSLGVGRHETMMALTTILEKDVPFF